MTLKQINFQISMSYHWTFKKLLIENKVFIALNLYITVGTEFLHSVRYRCK